MGKLGVESFVAKNRLQGVFVQDHDTDWDLLEQLVPISNDRLVSSGYHMVYACWRFGR